MTLLFYLVTTLQIAAIIYHINEARKLNHATKVYTKMTEAMQEVIQRRQRARNITQMSQHIWKGWNRES